MHEDRKDVLHGCENRALSGAGEGAVLHWPWASCLAGHGHRASVLSATPA